MARFTKDFRKELRRVTEGTEKGKFAWVALTESESVAARERAAGMGKENSRKPRAWFRKPETGAAGKDRPGEPAQAPRSGQDRPQDGQAPNGGTSPGASPGEARKERNKGAEAREVPLDVKVVLDKSFGKQLVGYHEMLALLTKNQIWRITPEQGDNLAQALGDVAAQYSIKINPKALAWIKLTGVASAMYGPKLWIIANTPKKKPAPPADDSPLGADVLGAGDGTKRPNFH
jgi:hypothetical protein